MISRIFALALLVTLPLCVATSHAATTVSDPNSDFTVTYDPAQAGLFGTLFLSNNTIFFVPDDFSAESVNGMGQVLTTETLNLQLDAVTAGFTFDSFNLTENLDYIVDGGSAEVSASGEMRVRDWDNPSAEFHDGFQFIDNGDAGPLTQQFSGSATIDAGLGWAGADSRVILTLQNVLTASTSDFGDLAFIQKKFEGIEIQVNPVPVPGAVYLFGSAILGLMGFRRGPRRS